MKRVVLLARRLAAGGAERQLVALARGLKARGEDVQVVLFYKGGAFEDELVRAGVPVHWLGKQSRWDIVGFLVRLVATLRQLRPSVVYSFLDLPNILAALGSAASGHPRLVWTIRAAGVEMQHYDLLMRLIPWIEARLSHIPDVISANSMAGLAWAVRRGFPAARMKVIENGIDTRRFRFDPEGRARLRRTWGVDESKALIGLVARHDPMKDHETFLHAAALVAREVPTARFVCVGDGPAAYTMALKHAAMALGLTDRLTWAGVLSDMAAVHSAVDIAASSSSYGEGFSNAIAEAMACERVCVATDVGDSARIVGSTGWVVPPRDPEALANAWTAALRLAPHERASRGLAARARIEAEFSLESMVDKTGQVLGLW